MDKMITRNGRVYAIGHMTPPAAPAPPPARRKALLGRTELGRAALKVTCASGRTA